LAAGVARADEGARVIRALVGLALHPARVAAGGKQVRAEAVAPLEPAAGGGARHPLIERQRLRAPVGRLVGERAAELLRVGEGHEAPLAFGERAEPSADRSGAGAGVIDLERRAV